jgi:hypothetical protein
MPQAHNTVDFMIMYCNIVSLTISATANMNYHLISLSMQVHATTGKKQWYNKKKKREIVSLYFAEP